MTHAIKDGDIFRWSYRADGQSYWCKSCICVARNGRLFDTYWHGNDNASWPIDVALKLLDLEYVGSFPELEKRPEYEASYYSDDDIVDLNHANSSSGNFYIRKGAKRSEAKMRQVIAKRIARAENEIKSRKRAIADLRTHLAEIDTGEPLEGICL